MQAISFESLFFIKFRFQVNLYRSITFRNSKQTYNGIPVMASNMDTVGTFEMAKALSKVEFFFWVAYTFKIHNKNVQCVPQKHRYIDRRIMQVCYFGLWLIISQSRLRFRACCKNWVEVFLVTILFTHQQLNY